MNVLKELTNVTSMLNVRMWTVHSIAFAKKVLLEMASTAVSYSEYDHDLSLLVFALQQACEDNEVFLFGGNSSQGQVGICNNNTYEFICDDFWDELDAQVVCRQLGLDTNGYSIPTSGAYFGTGTAMEIIALDNVKCLGNETSIRECLADSDVNCGQSEKAGVICQYQGKSCCIYASAIESNIIFHR